MNNTMIINKVVDGGPALRIPAHLSLGQHLIDCLRKICEDKDNVALVSRYLSMLFIS